jgi:hypothetical protein
MCRFVLSSIFTLPLYRFAVFQRRCDTLARCTADSRLSSAFSGLFAPSVVLQSADA